MNKYNIIRDERRARDITYLNAYSISDNCKIFFDNITSLIKNIKLNSFDYELSYNRARYITKNNVKILCMNPVTFDNNNKRNLFVALTNDMNVLTECLFYIAVKHGDTNSIEYLISYYVNKENIENLKYICTECHVEPLTYVISNYENKFSLKHLASKKIRSVCTDINKLPIPFIIQGYIRDISMIKEIIYDKKNKDHCYIRNSYENYLRLIQKFGLPNIVNSRLFVKGIKEFKCNIHNSCGHSGIENNKKNYILYCVIISYNISTYEAACTNNVKYVSITFHQYKETDNSFGCYCSQYYLNTVASMNCEILEKLPPYYDLIPKHPIYLSITAGSFDEHNRKIENEVFIFVEMGINYWYPNGYYKLNLELFKPQPRYLI